MAAWMHWLRPQVESENLFIHGLVFFIKFLQSKKKKRENSRIYEQSRGPGSNTQKKILALWGKKLCASAVSHTFWEN
jgi:hypothetical protein